MDGEVRNVKNTAPGLNQDRATGTIALDAGTQLGKAQDEFANRNSPTLQRNSQDHVELKFSLHSA